MENTRRELAEYEEVHTALMKTLEQDNMQLQVEKIAGKYHHLLGTSSVPGILGTKTGRNFGFGKWVVGV